MSDLQALARTIYDACSPNIQKLYTSNELLSYIPKRDAQELLATINELLGRGYLRTLKQGDAFVYQFISKDSVDRTRNLTPDEALVYQHIESSAREGIWSKILKTRTNLHPTVLTRCLKTLETHRYIKSVKSVKNPTRKIYMLSDLTPAIEVTGGPWFTDAELDADFINALLVAIERFVTSRSFPKQKPGAAGIVIPFEAGYTGYPTLSDITHWVKNSNLTEVDLSEADIKALLEVLIYDGKLEKVIGGTAYKAIRKVEGAVKQGVTEAPCGRCPVFDLCNEDGPINAANCVYFEKWLAEI
ncbi:34-kDa subunit of RNA polymerase III (C) [Orbilia blumenaviensis]|uniref:DNA-directed RNA polymerase III subunit RPC6 n=1 Tax=Orbilia blumenaviensis TaxID=1796055 RepID=A0AAV9UHD4_9PEZI